MPGGLHKNEKVPVAHLVNRHGKGIHPDSMRRTFLIAALLTTHQEMPGGNHGAGGFSESLWSLVALGGTLLVGQRNHEVDASLLCGNHFPHGRTRRSFGVRQLAAAFLPASLLAGISTRTRFAASKLAGEKAAASCRTPKLRAEGNLLYCAS